MVQAQKGLTPEQEKIATDQAQKIVRETMVRHGAKTAPTEREMARITQSAISKLKGPEMKDLRPRVEQAYLDHLRKKSPKEYERVNTELTGKRHWDNLAAANMHVNVEGTSMTMKDAIKLVSQTRDVQQRLNMFNEIVKQFAEMYRLKPNEKNDFNKGYDTFATNPDKLLRQGNLNCFSGTIALGAMINYAARVANVGEYVRTEVVLISSFKATGRGWDDSGHALLSVQSGKDRFFFDSTNTMTANHGDSLYREGSEIKSRGLMGPTYRVGALYALNSRIMNVARFQDGVLSAMQEGKTLSASQVAQVAKMPEAFQTKLVNALSEEQQRKFFSSVSLSSMSPENRFTMASIAFKASKPGSPAALNYAREGVKALEASIRNKTSDRLSVASVYDNVTKMISALESSQSAADRALVDHGSMHSYLANAALQSRQGTLTREQLRAGASAIRDFMKYHKKSYDEGDMKFKSVLTMGLLRSEALANNNVIGAETRSTLNTMLSSMGVRNPSAFTAEVRERVRKDQNAPPGAANNPNLEIVAIQIAVGAVGWGAGVQGKSMDQLRQEFRGAVANAVFDALELGDHAARGSQLYAAISKSTRGG